VEVSIIIPNYNHRKFLPQRLDTIFRQSFQDFEVILLDDCSTDESWDYLKQFIHHPKVSQCIRNDANSGSPFKQWKKGIDLAKYNWIWIAESDDYCEYNFLEEMIRKLDNLSVLVYCNSYYIDLHDNLIRSKFPNWDLNDSDNILRWDKDYSNDGESEILNFISFRNIIVNASSVLFRKPSKFPSEILSMKYCGDWYFWIYILQFGRINYKFKKMNYFRSHEYSSRSFNLKNSEMDRLKEISKCIQFARVVSSINYPRVLDIINYSYLTKYYAWNFRNLKLPVYFLIYLPWFLIPVVIFNYIHHRMRKISNILIMYIKKNKFMIFYLLII